MNWFRRFAKAPSSTSTAASIDEPSNPFVALADLVRAGDQSSHRYADLCLKAGLIRRFANVWSASALLRADLLVAARYASATDDRALLSATLAAALRGRVDGTVTDFRLRKIVEQCWVSIPQEATEAMRSIDPDHPVLLRRGGRPGSLAEAPVDAGSEWHLAAANLASGSDERLACINRALAQLGQAPIQLIDPAAGVRVPNLLALPAPGNVLMTPVLSVVMTCFNNAEELTSSTSSILGQTFSDLELIVVDDGSKDDSLPLLRRIAERDPRVSVHSLTRNVGTYAAKNLGLSRARGTYVAFNDADDWSHPTRFFDAVRLIESDPCTVAVSGCYFRLAEDGRIHSARSFPLIRWSPNTLVFRREPVLSKIGYHDANRFGSDSEFAARLRAVFGERSHRRMSSIQFVAAHRQNSLMTGAQYGLDAGGRSDRRQHFEEDWAERLLTDLVARNVPYRSIVVPSEAERES